MYLHNKHKTLVRKRLNETLNSIFLYPLTILQAPMGYGKTTAIQHFVECTKVDYVWCSLTTIDSSASYFWRKFISQISKLNLRLGNELKRVNIPNEFIYMRKVVDIFQQYTFVEPVVIVIDDFHYVKNKTMFKLLGMLVYESIPNLHFVIATRNMLNMDTTELEYKDLCLVIKKKSLKFTHDEITQYFSLINSLTSEDDIKQILEYTGGWISLIYLVQYGVQQNSPLHKKASLYHLVEENLFCPLDEEMKQFLLKLAVLDYFTDEQAAFVLEDGSTSDKILRLYSENAFIVYDQEEGVYKIHNVLLDYLRNMQLVEGIDVQKLYKRAGIWGVQDEKYRKMCLVYLYKAGEVESILGLLESFDSKNVISNLKYKEFCEEHLDLFEMNELLYKYPTALMRYIVYVLFESDCTKKKVEGLTRLQNLLNVYENNAIEVKCTEVKEFIRNMDKKKKNQILAAINVAMSYAFFNDVDRMIYYQKKAFRLVGNDNSYYLSTYLTMGSPHLLYTYYSKRRQLKRTLIKFSAYNSDFLNNRIDNYAGFLNTMFAEYALETGDWENVESFYRIAISKTHLHNEANNFIHAHFTYFRLLLFQGQFEKVEELICELIKTLEEYQIVDFNHTLDLCLGYIYGCLGLIEKIPNWLKMNDLSSYFYLRSEQSFHWIIYAKSVLLSENYIQLELLCEQSDEYFGAYNNQLGFLHSYIYHAIAKYQLYGMAEGKDMLLKALELGEADHIILPFGENASYLLPMLLDLQKNPEHIDALYLSKVMNCCQKYEQNLLKLTNKESMLSQNEETVLKYIASGMKRREIAYELFVSVASVNKIVESIYKKLSVHNKTSAIIKAKELNLL
ncbi:helix-turn-helix transcriptional regulator [Bacillus massiliigorillae]|uniref:helix-turn-helix transcriptional regulator n=1 Tax=Bacillus massiliigorillae TaxID=1243664 RepID=UPI0003A83D7C|nr:LuxR C-terminal-related transcriptional regulator [Bacillus massiliigorillae]